jgi:hypothetical protein
MYYREFYARVAAPKTESNKISQMLKKGELGMLVAIAEKEPDEAVGPDEGDEGDDGVLEDVIGEFDEDGNFIEGEQRLEDEVLDGDNYQGEEEAENEEGYGD